jgi:hypothetical protein
MVEHTIGGADQRRGMLTAADLLTTKGEVCRRCHNYIESPLRVVHYWGRRSKKTYDDVCFMRIYQRLIKWRSLRGLHD